MFARLAEDADCSFPRLVGPDERFADVMPDLLEGTSLTRLRNAAIARPHAPPGPDGRPVPRQPDHDHRRRRGRRAGRRAAARRARSRSAGSPVDLVDRIEVIIRFLAVLELFKQGVVEIDQPERFGDIEIEWSGAMPTSTARRSSSTPTMAER